MKYQEEIELQIIAKKIGFNLFILRPTEIIGDKSINAQKFIKSYALGSFFKKFLLNSIYGSRITHFVSSRYLIDTILEIIDGSVSSGFYLVSQDINEINNFFDLSKTIDKILNKKVQNKKPTILFLLINYFFRFVYKVVRGDQIPLDSKFISEKPIIDPNSNSSFEKEFILHVKYILNIK